MGIAATQCRLLLLTARKSDLELRAQMITQRKIMLATQQEQVSNAYTEALRNRQLKWTVGFNGNSNTQTSMLMTYNQVTTSPHEGENYRVEDAYGNIVFRDGKDPAIASALCMKISMVVGVNDAGEVVSARVAGTSAGGSEEEITKNKLNETEGTDASGNHVTYKLVTADVQVAKINDMGVIEGLDKFEYGGVSLNIGDLKPADLTAASPNVGRNVAFYGDVLDNTSYFQQALRSGTFVMAKLNEGTATNDSPYCVNNYERVVFQSLTGVTDALYSEDDAEAQSVYETEMAKIQTQDKIYDNELKQVETQQKAADTEIDGIKSLLKGNIEKSFKIFSNG